MNRFWSKRPLISITICWLLMYVASGQASVIQASTAENNSATTKFIPYNNGLKHGLAIEYPENWNITERDSGVWFSSPGDGSGNFGIQIQPTQNKSLQELVKIQLVQYSEGVQRFSCSIFKKYHFVREHSKPDGLFLQDGGAKILGDKFVRDGYY